MLATIAERIKAVVPGNRDPKATLAESLNQLRVLVEEIARREKFVDEAIQLLNNRLTSYAQSGAALDAALSGGDVGVVRVAIERLEAKSDHSAALQQRLKTLTMASSLRIPRDEYLKEHREARTLLQTVCVLHLQQAETNLSNTRKDEQARLDELGEDYDASASPVVKRGASKVEQLKGMLNRIEREQDLAMYFVNFAQQLLSHE